MIGRRGCPMLFFQYFGWHRQLQNAKRCGTCGTVLASRTWSKDDKKLGKTCHLLPAYVIVIKCMLRKGWVRVARRSWSKCDKKLGKTFHLLPAYFIVTKCLLRKCWAKMTRRTWSKCDKKLGKNGICSLCILLWPSVCLESVGLGWQ